jgi:hypothetical protein
VNATRKAMLFREVNERIAELLARAWPSAPGDFLCECGDESCTRRVTLTLPEYEAIARGGGGVLAHGSVRPPSRPRGVCGGLAAVI